MTETCYKLTSQDMTTHGNYKWELGKWHRRSGEGGLCGPGWLHAYSDPVLALFMNPTHANIIKPRLFLAEGRGKKLDDSGLKCGFTQMRLIEELPYQEPTTEQRVEFGIRCALAVCKKPDFVAWAENWISGKDRTAPYATTTTYAATNAATAYATAYAAYAAYAATAYATYAATNAAAAANAAAANAAFAATNAWISLDLIAIAHKVMGD